MEMIRLIDRLLKLFKQDNEPLLLELTSEKLFKYDGLLYAEEKREMLEQEIDREIIFYKWGALEWTIHYKVLNKPITGDKKED